MQYFWKGYEKLLDVLKVLGAVSLTGMMLLTCADVVGRFFGHPILGSVELVGFMATLAVGFALPYTHQVKAHIGVEILVRLLSSRTQIIIDLCTHVVSLLLVALIAWRMAIYGKTMKASGEVSMNLEFPEYIIIYIVAFCFLAFLVQIIHDIHMCLIQLRKK